MYDEKCTSFFFNKIRKRKSKNFIHKIQDEDNTLKTDIQDILKVFHKFYGNVYSEFSGNIDVQNKILESLSCQNCNTSGDTEETSLFSEVLQFWQLKDKTVILQGIQRKQVYSVLISQNSV